MKTIDTPVDDGMFRTSTLKSDPVKVDRKANVIFGASLMQEGDLNDARPWAVDQKTLAQAMQFGSQSKNGLKARYTHPNMSSDGMGSYLGRWKNLRIDGDKLRADLHISDAAFTSPQGDLGTYVMDLAESDPEAFGVSLATKLDQEDLESFDQDTSEDKPERWPMRFSSIRAGDVVDEPAATRGGLFSLTEPSLKNLPAQATALLTTYFGDAEPEVVRGRINGFLDRYFQNRGDVEMSTEAPTETVEAVDVVETPTEDLATETEVVTEVVTTTEPVADLSERERCKKIRVLVDLAKCPEKFNQFVDAGFSVEETQTALRELVGKKNPSLSQDPEAPADPDAKYKAEYAANKAVLSVSEEEYVRSCRISDGLESLM